VGAGITDEVGTEEEEGGIENPDSLIGPRVECCSGGT
jgi:hypothetical protein